MGHDTCKSMGKSGGSGTTSVQSFHSFPIIRTFPGLINCSARLFKKRQEFITERIIQKDLTFGQNIKYRNGTHSETSDVPIGPLLTTNF